MTGSVRLRLEGISSLDRRELERSLSGGLDLQFSQSPPINEDSYGMMQYVDAFVTVTLASLPVLALFLCTKRSKSETVIEETATGRKKTIRKTINEGCVAAVIAELREWFPFEK